MRTLLLLLPLAGLSLAQPQGGGFFSGLGDAFSGFFGGSPRQPPRQAQRPQRPQRRPPQQQQFQQQQFQPQQQQFQPQQQQFQQQPQEQFRQPQQQFQQQPQQFQQQQSFQQPQQQPFQQPAAPQFNPRPQPTAAPTPAQPVGGTSLCGAASPNHFWRDTRDNVQRGYVVTWKIGCTTFQQHEAKAYCNSMGMEPVSLDSPAKQDNFNRLIAQDAQRYFWTGGEVDHSRRVVNWNNKGAKPIGFDESAHWSHTGGADLPQPDDRAFGEDGQHEVCLGILNNFYADGIKWHDVACHHKKPTVCEPRN